MEHGILIVDDEKNIRLTLTHALASLGAAIEIAGSGEEALEKLEARPAGIVLLDLKLPGMGGMEVLRRIRDTRPGTRVIIVTAHGTIDNAVEAMKLGAVDFIQKPFSPSEIRTLVASVMERERLEAHDVKDYTTALELAKKEITNRRFETARGFAQKAIAIDSSRPEAFVLLAALLELQGDYLRAEKLYRTALSLEPAYLPAKRNLERLAAIPAEERTGARERSGIMGFFSSLFSGGAQERQAGPERSESETGTGE